MKSPNYYMCPYLAMLMIISLLTHSGALPVNADEEISSEQVIYSDATLEDDYENNTNQP